MPLAYNPHHRAHAGTRNACYRDFKLLREPLRTPNMRQTAPRRLPNNKHVSQILVDSPAAVLFLVISSCVLVYFFNCVNTVS